MFKKINNWFETKAFTPEKDDNFKFVSNINDNIKLLNWNGFNIYQVNLASQYTNNAVVRAVIDRVVNAIINLEPIVLNTETHQEDTKNPINNLLKNPNEEQTFRELARDLLCDLYINGSYYMYCKMSGNDVLYLKRILKQNIQKLTEDNMGNVIDYSITIGNSQVKVKNMPYYDKRASILKQTFYNPLSDNFKDDGTSPLLSASDAINHLNSANKYNLSFLENGARPSLAFIVSAEDGRDGTLTEEQYEALRKQIEEKYTGSGNAGRPLLLEGGIQVKELSNNMRDMDFAKLQELSIAIICMCMGVYVEELGFGKSTTFAEEARKAFILNTIIPIANGFYDKLDSFLMPKFDKTGKLKLTYRKQSINLLMKDIFDIMKKGKETEALSTNDIRDIGGYDNVKNGDEVRISMSTAPLGAISKNFQETGAINDKTK